MDLHHAGKPDQASQQLLRKLCNGTPEKHSMEDLFKKIRELVVRSDSLQQRRITQMLNFKQRQGEAFSQTLCRLEETEKDVDIDNYSVAEMQAHLRIAACTDPKLKEELLKLGQPDINGDPTEPITSDLIWNATKILNKERNVSDQTGMRLPSATCRLPGKGADLAWPAAHQTTSTATATDTGKCQPSRT